MARVYTPKDTAVSTPNSDTPYSFVQLDLRAEPMVLCMPEIEVGRYYDMQLTDMYTFNFGYMGSPHHRQRRRLLYGRRAGVDGRAAEGHQRNCSGARPTSPSPSTGLSSFIHRICRTSTKSRRAIPSSLSRPISAGRLRPPRRRSIGLSQHWLPAPRGRCSW